MRTSKEYRAALVDGRKVYIDGKVVEDAALAAAITLTPIEPCIL